MRLRILFILLSLFFVTSTLAADPALHFSDITSGPDTGLGDPNGSGAIVTVWGSNLGTSIGSSTITYKAADDTTYTVSSSSTGSQGYVYYWENADPDNGDSGPSDLYSRHGYQEIAFSIPDITETLPDAGSIYVTVGGINSNELTFTVRSGDIYFVSTTGSDNYPTQDGSYDEPWATLEYFTVTGTQWNAGDMIYVMDGVSQSGSTGLAVGSGAGQMDCVDGVGDPLPCSVITYPGATATFTGSSTGIKMNTDRESDRGTEYWNFSKLAIISGGCGINQFYGGRIVGNSVTDTGYCAEGSCGAIHGGRDAAGAMKIYGNYIYEWGCETTSKFHHTTYWANRCGDPVAANDVGWNYLLDNQTRGGIHHWDQGICGDHTGTLKIHDNVVENQVGVAIGIGTDNGSVDPCYTMDVEIYNNLIILAGQAQTDGDFRGEAFSFTGTTNHINLLLYNNTVYGYEVATGQNGGDGCFITLPNDTEISWEYKNNIVIDLLGVPFEDEIPGMQTPDAAGNNLWYSVPGLPGGYDDPPGFDPGSLSENPDIVSSITPIETGTTDGTGTQKLIDGGQNFTSTVSVGMIVRNVTDSRLSRVTAIDSDSTLSIYHDMMTSGESYQIYQAPNLNLSSDSPCIDAGANTSAILTRDIKGLLRSEHGSAYDIGAYEFESGVGDTDPPVLSSPSPSGPVSCPDSNPMNINLEITAIDNVGVTACKYCEDGVGGCTSTTDIDDMTETMSNVSGNLWRDTQSHNCAQSYTYNVKCEDLADNESSNAQIVFSIGNPDTDPPVISNPLPTGEQICDNDPLAVTLQITTDEDADCKWCEDGVAGCNSLMTYDAMPNDFTTTGAQTHQEPESLACGDSYLYYAHCADKFSPPNKSTVSTAISFSIASSPVPAPSISGASGGGEMH